MSEWKYKMCGKVDSTGVFYPNGLAMFTLDLSGFQQIGPMVPIAYAEPIKRIMNAVEAEDFIDAADKVCALANPITTKELG